MTTATWERKTTVRLLKTTSLVAGRDAIFARLAIVAILAVTASGCGSDLAAVHGKVQREGNALSEGRVAFIPVGGGHPASGEIQSDGSFQLTTLKPNDGAAPGTYRIIVKQFKGTDLGTVSTAFVAPNDKTLQIVAGKDNEFPIEIREKDGWKVHQEK